MGALATKTAGILSSSSPHEVFGGALESDDLFGREELGALRELEGDLRGLDGVLGVYSIFDARAQEFEGLSLPPLIPAAGAPVDEFSRAREMALEHPLLGGLLLSEDARVTVMVVTQEGDELPVAEIEPLYAAVKGEVDENLEGVGVRGMVTGIPALRADIIRAVQRDNLRFSVFGGATAMLISMLLFRNLAAVFITGWRRSLEWC
ncbi:MAG: putative RND superfamily exporter protein [Verrucomicrobiales bacterium]